MEFGLLAAALLAGATTWAVLRSAPTPDARTAALTDVALGAALSGLAMGRIWSMMAAGVNPITNLGDAIIVRSGVHTVGASIGALAAAAILARGRVAATLDALAPAALAGLAAWHASCVIRSACLGTTTGLPWGVAATAGGPPRHPVEVYAALLFGLAAVTAYIAAKRRLPAGSLAAAAFTIAAAVRGATEPLRPTLAGLELYYWSAAAAGAAVTGLILIAHRRTESA